MSAQASLFTPMLPAYAELQSLSNFSFLRGASHPEELVMRAAALGYSALAVTDECSLAGVVRAHVQAKDPETPIKLIVGSQFTLTKPDGTPALSLVALAQNRNGYGNLCELITLARTRADKGSYLVIANDFTSPPPDLAHLRGLPDCQIILSVDYGIDPDTLSAQAAWVAAAFPGRCRLGLCLLNRAQDTRHRAVVEQIAALHDLPIVATGQVEMHVRSRKPLHDTMCAIRLGKPVADCGFALSQNAEQHVRSRLHLANLYKPDVLAETLKVADSCTFSLDELKYEYPEEVVPPGETPGSYLRRETWAGAHERFGPALPPKLVAQLTRELDLIVELNYEAYFLTVYDIVKFARNHRILCQGRGSAANSAVCFCLGITAVSPMESELLFERFISRERSEPPDIDVDFEHQRREEVIQYIYAKYGRDRAALTAVVISYRPRSVLRDVGKALGVDLAVVDQVAKTHQWWDGKAGLNKRFVECGFDPESLHAQRWGALSERLMGFPRHLSQHPGGFVMSRGKLSRLVPIENATMADRSVVQWDKDDLDAVGLLKVDVLALGMLTVIRRALDLVSQQRGRVLEMYQIPADDTATYDMICAADTMGVFQIESRAQMTMLPRLRPRRLYDLVVEVAIVRPGPIQGGMVHPYLKRRQGLEPIEYPSPQVEQALARTLGVPIFQEQVMQIAILAGGYTAGEADQLRRSMAAWKRKGGLEKHRTKLMAGMLGNGYDVDFAEAIFRQIEGFGEYGFPESHASSFAQLAYVSSWLKCHEPEAFLTALLNSQPMGFYSPYQLVQDAKRHGVKVLPVDVCISDWDAKLDNATQPPSVRIGLNQIQGLAEAVGRRIVDVRRQRMFTDTTDLGRRAGLDRHSLQALAAANALQALSGHRRTALWEAVDSVPERGLLRDAGVHEPAPDLPAPTESEEIVADYQSLRMTLNRHPLALLRGYLGTRGFMAADRLNQFPDGRLARAAGIVTVRQRPGTAHGTIFVTLEDETGPVNVIVWPSLVDAQRKELLGSSLLGVYGIWQSHQGVRSLVAKRLVDLSGLLGKLNTESRNFH